MQPVFSSDSDSPDILPMSGKSWRFTIVGIRFMVGQFVTEMDISGA
jgi:hypothetical protein